MERGAGAREDGGTGTGTGVGMNRAGGSPEVTDGTTTALVCGFCKRPPEEHGDSDAGPMTVCPSARPLVADHFYPAPVRRFDCSACGCTFDEDELQQA